MRSDLPEIERRLFSAKVGAAVGVIVCSTGLSGFWTDFAPLMHTEAKYWSGSWLVLLHFGALALWGAAIGFAWQKKPDHGHFRIWGSGLAPVVEPEPDSLTLVRRGLGRWAYPLMGLLLLMALSLPTFRLAIVGSILVLLAIQRNYARWEIGTNGRYYLMHTFCSLQWFEDLKVVVPERHLRPKVKGLDSLPFRRAECLAAVGPRSDELPYQVRRRRARYFALSVYLLACLVVFAIYWMKSDVRYDSAFITVLILYSMLPWFFVPRSVAYATLPSGVNNGPLKFPQPVRPTNLLIEVGKPGWTLLGCVATGGCLGMFGGVFALGLFLPLLPVLGLLEMLKALHPVAMCLPWAVFYLQVFVDRPRRLKWLELDPHVLGVIEHVLVREYQFSKPKSERAVALGIRPLSGAISNTAFVPLIYFSNGESIPLAAVGVAKEVATERARELASRMFLPVVPPDVGQSLAEEWIRAGLLQEKVASSWPKVKQRDFDPIDEVPPLD